MKTYSFLDTQCTIVGPGGAISIGPGAGNSKEGISIEPSQDVNAMTVGADGEGYHNLHADKSGRATIRLLKTSPVNGQLSLMYNVQRASSAAWGQNTIALTNNTLGDAITCQNVAFGRVPTLTYAEDGAFNEWRFDSIKIDMGLGK